MTAQTGRVSQNPLREGPCRSHCHARSGLVWLIGYRPTAITERLTMLVLLSGQEADPGCPCPRAAGRRGCRGRGQRLNRGLEDGTDPYEVAGHSPTNERKFGIGLCLGDALLGLQRALPESSYRW